MMIDTPKRIAADIHRVLGTMEHPGIMLPGISGLDPARLEEGIFHILLRNGKVFRVQTTDVTPDDL